MNFTQFHRDLFRRHLRKYNKTDEAESQLSDIIISDPQNALTTIKSFKLMIELFVQFVFYFYTCNFMDYYYYYPIIIPCLWALVG